jgi:hypothetical protein
MTDATAPIAPLLERYRTASADGSVGDPRCAGCWEAG